ncbi:hypothetical protein [Fibrella forsythiae]|uniref:Glycine zipper 2TM domain-containing protein n=1 Tax=Fibrella forsythiae TaxID=2817061 RepID=A0ABS3JHF0_9BACT|nr:hypothetical protein [Fibrella forsythiae]MBO0948841.1 hypothetical protein [Fibrella forsythiae]
MKTNQRIIALALLVGLFVSPFAQAQRKWNPEAKGTAIGAGVGGVAGAIINKRDRKVGAGVGLAVGAAAGYGIGKVIDNRHKKAAAAARAAEDREFAARTATENRELRSGTSNRNASVRKVEPISKVSTATAQNSVLTAPEPVTVPLVRNGFLLNTSYGDPNTAYPTSEYRRKSW